MNEFINSSVEKIDEYIELYNKAFNKFDKNRKYFDWLYKKNPSGQFVGIDCYFNNIIIGQVGGIPLEFYYLGRKLRFLISINVCVDPAHQGKKLFSKMAIKFEKLAEKLNFDGIIAIANKAATPAWQKSINLNLLKQLDVLIGFNRFKDENFNKDDYNFYSSWNNEKLKWRIENTHNKTFLRTENQRVNSVYSVTDYPFLQAYAPLIFTDKLINTNTNNKFLLKPIIFIGLTKKITKNLFIKLPEVLKPSPLNFLYKFIKSNNKLDSKKVFFTFLDFDVF
jgi:hypothetical protein